MPAASSETTTFTMNAPKELPASVINAIFVLGLFSSICFRVLLIADALYPPLFRPIWYAGVLGYCGFFLHRYRITRKRKNAIRGMDLIAKVNQNSLGAEDQKAVSYILSSIDHSKEGLNYLIIFALSALAIAADLYLSH
ncbi:MAG: hypothetical protein BA871_07415 [Desulfuromonadales bacterium C00003096]|jgi:hypothetical protein|nr:MAG: hypothetical protein BA871_07415 [Desulfuromonadales bacterium C00003096]